MKQCSVCLTNKPLNEFYKEKASPDGHRTQCKDCRKTSVAQWRENNKARYNATMRAYNKKNYRKLRLYRYDLTEEQFNKMMQDQNGMCAICSKPPGGTRPLAIDHCHTTGKVRGLLCYNCNRLMYLLDNPLIMASAIKYLNK